MKVLLLIAWSLWGAAVLALCYGLYVILTEQTHSPEATRGLGIGLMLLLFLLAAAIGLALRWSAQRESTAGVLAIICILIFPVVSTVAGKVIRAVKDRTYTADAAKEGDFPDPQAKLLAAAIASGDIEALRTHLSTHPNTNTKDRAGNTLLGYAIRRFRFENGKPECIRLLLSAGADPNVPGDASGWPPLMELGEFPDVVRALVEAGANIETLADGIPPVVRFTGGRNWESAIYLVEKGARLDTKTPEGLSLDYYIEDWKDSVHGDHPEGWDRLRAAIAKRRQ